MGKVIEKIKNYVKENKTEIIISCVSGICAGAVSYYTGYKIGFNEGARCGVKSMACCVYADIDRTAQMVKGWVKPDISSEAIEKNINLANDLFEIGEKIK